MTVFAAQWSDVLGALHGLFALVMLLTFAMGLIFTFAVSEHNWKHIQTAGFAAAFSYLVTFGFGLLAYPMAKVYMSKAPMNPETAASIGLLEIKEHLAALGAFVALALLVLILFGHLRRASTWRRQLFAALFINLVLLGSIAAILAYVLGARR